MNALTATAARVRAWWRDQRGSSALLTVIVAAGLLAMSGLVFDGAEKMRAGRLASEAAAEAARAAGQHLNPGVIGGAPIQVSPAKGAAAARAYLADAGVNGTVSVNGTTITVNTAVAWAPRVYSFVPGSTLTATSTVTSKHTN